MKAPHKSSSEFPANSLVCVVDDDDLVRRGLARLFRSGGASVEMFASADAFLAHPAHDGPFCLVLDVQMPGIDGIELQRTLASREVQIVFLTGHGDVPMCANAMKAGAVDFLTKPVDDDALLFNAVSQALARSVEIRLQRSERAAARSRLSDLTPREFEVMRRVIAGMLNKQIAGDLGSAEKTVKIHRGRVMAKMGVTSVADLVRAAQAAGISPSPVAVGCEM